MDAGGLAQMTFNNFHQNNAPSFGSRGKGTHLRNISVPASNNLTAPAADANQATTPRSARSQLLAGLRTAPKTPTPGANSSAAESLEASRYANNNHYTGFTQNANVHPRQQQQQQQQQQRLPTPPSVASPAIHVSDGDSDELEHDPYAQMMAQNAYLAHIQQQVAAAQKVAQLQQQLAQLQMQSSMGGYSATPPMSPGMGLNLNSINMYNNPAMYPNMYSQYQQQYPQNHNNGGGNSRQQQQQQQQQLQQQQLQQQYMQQQQQQQLQLQQQQQQQLQQQQQQQYLQQYQQQQSMTQVELTPPSPVEQPGSAGLGAHRQNSRSRSPPKLSLQSSATNTASFRRHRKASSLSTCTTLNNLEIADGPKTAMPNKMSMLPSTPLTATFGPGHASGTHPIRQPRGPPSIEELKAKPTSKVEGSQNFATRVRRRAISKLVSAGIERRSNRSVSGSVGGTMTPVSENDGFAFEETESIGSTASVGRNSRQSQRDAEGNNSSADEGSASGRRSARPTAGLRAPNLAPSADKRKSALF